jgi:hypothetical protein
MAGMTDMSMTQETRSAALPETRPVQSPSDESRPTGEVGAWPQGDAEGTASPKVLFFLLLVYLVLDYGRPQDVIPSLGIVRPAAIVTALLAVAFLAVPRLWVRGNGQFHAVWAFVALLFAWVPFARNNFFAYKTAESMLLLLPFVLSVPVCLKSLRAIRGALAFCVLLMAYQAGFAALHGGRGTGAGLADENDLALYVNTFLPFAYFLFRTDTRVRWKVFYAVATVVGVAGIVASRSRGGFVGLLAVGAVTWFLSPRKIRSLVLIGLVAAGVLWFASASYWERMSTATDSETGTGRARVESWGAGWRMFLDNPLGVGGNNFEVRFPAYQSDYFKRGMWGRVAHSLWFTVLAELGVPGVLVYGLLLFFNLRDSVRLRAIGRTVGGDDGRLLGGLGSAFLASFAGFFASGTFLSVLYYPHYWYLTGFIVATYSVAAGVGRERAIISTS